MTRHCSISAAIVAILGASAAADPPTETVPDPPPPPTLSPPPVLKPSWDLDGIYVWLGPVGAAGYEAQTWDSAFGGDATFLRVREHQAIAGLGGTLGASKWTTHEGGQVWLEGLIATELGGHMVGASLGPLVEISEYANPQLGGAVGIWAFAGLTPYVKVGVIDTLGGFVELGVHFALPVFRR